MDSVRSDDFAGLLAALGRSAAPSAAPTNATTFIPQIAQPSQFPAYQQSLQAALQPQPYPWYQQQWGPNVPHFSPEMMQAAAAQQAAQNVAQATQQMTSQIAPQKLEARINPWIVGGLILIVLLCVIIVWARLTRVVSKEEEELEPTPNVAFERDVRKEPREVPVPSDVESDEDIGSYVAENLLQYVNGFQEESKKSNEIDISGLDIPFQVEAEVRSSTRESGKRIIADDSPEVVDYAKRRDALFKTSHDNDGE
jgi:hypothetical protein